MASVPGAIFNKVPGKKKETIKSTIGENCLNFVPQKTELNALMFGHFTRKFDPKEGEMKAHGNVTVRREPQCDKMTLS